MDYFKLLHFRKEPFSSTPDPDAFYQASQPMGCLQKLELAIRMRRGLNVVIGEAGTGKTTLCRQLIRKLDQNPQIKSHLILDPSFASGREFLVTVATMLGSSPPDAAATEQQLKDGIKQHLSRRSADDNKIVLLVIDEGQKLPAFCLEILREFLNYGTEESRLLQTVIFASPQFEAIAAAHKNFADRITLHQTIGPLNYQETREMIRLRLDQVSESGKSPAYFSRAALWIIYQATKGFPRKIVNLCHLIMVTMVIQNRVRAGWYLAYACARKFFPEQARQWQRRQIGALATVVLVMVLTAVGIDQLPVLLNQRGVPPVEQTAPAAPAPETAPPPAATTESSPAPVPPAAVTTEASPAPAAPAPAAPATPASGPPAVPVQAPPSAPAIAAPEKLPAVPAPATAATSTESWNDLTVLGEITVGKGETLGDMIRRIYGPYSFTPKNTKTVLASNPQITNPNRVGPGVTIAFPAMPVRLPPQFAEVFWVQTATTVRLDEAYRLLRKFDGKAPPMIIIPVRAGQAGLQFTILLENYCLDEKTAKETVAALPPPLAEGAKILTGLDKRRAYFK